ncbi:3-oxoacyl-[acyl-carrier-protein] reductase FabG-like [Dysidea avara]|uniref:3-oxoacyl-[acyl-carrier-protein] reductase FabG-like n=1 Tax=Dysidea avara TaxID=196820 RepID=UPI00332A0D9A
MSATPEAKKKKTDYSSPRFGGKVAIVTGGASGIGLATVEQLAQEGTSVAIFDIDKSAGEKAVEEFSLQGMNVTFYEVDISDKDQCVAAVKKVADNNNGLVHFLVNSAAFFSFKGITTDKEDWDNSFGVNVVGFANMVQACYPYMKEMKGVDKSVVNISSAAAHRSLKDRWAYSASKGAIISITKCMALDLSIDGIRVNSISPGWVWTPIVMKLAAEDGGREKWEPICANYHMLRRFCEASEVASAICFLLSQDASYITGTDLPVDGGFTSMSPEGYGESI